MQNVNVVFGRVLLTQARKGSPNMKLYGKVYALKSGFGQYFVECDNPRFKDYVSASNAYEAKAEAIIKWDDRLAEDEQSLPREVFQMNGYKQ